MSRQWRVPLLAGILAVLAVIDTALAWNGNNVALIALTSIALITSLFAGIYGKMAIEVLDGWKESTDGWAKTQDWGMAQHKILQDTIADLQEHDEEAAAIHTGRSAKANIRLLDGISIIKEPAHEEQK